MASGDARKALAQAIGALNIVADVENDPTRDAFRVTFMDGQFVLLDSEIGHQIAAVFALLERELLRPGVRPAW